MGKDQIEQRKMIEKEKIRRTVTESIQVHQAILQDDLVINAISEGASICVESLNHQGKILLCGNGGSAADAQHIAAELSGRYLKNRGALYAEALHVNTSAVTAISNDFGFAHVYARQIEGMGRPGDVLIALSTSGNSENIIRAMQQAKSNGMKVLLLTGEHGGKAVGEADLTICVPSQSTPRIQEGHILIGHILCQVVENAIFSDEKR